METNKIFMDVAQRAREFAEMCRLMQKIPDMSLTAEVKDALDEYAKRLGLPKADPEAWEVGVKFEKRWYDGTWNKGNAWKFDGNKEGYREVPQYEMQIEQPVIGVISGFNKWDRALTEKEISDLFSGKVRPEDIPQEVSAECQNALEHLAKTYSADKGTAQLNPTIPPHAAERALWKAQRESGTNEVWQARNIYDHGPSNWADLSVYTEPQWAPKAEYRVKPMKLTARIIRRGVYKTSYYWEFTGTREEYRAECEKYGYIVISEIKEVVEKPKTVKYYFALIKNKFGTVDSLAAASMISFNRIAEKNSYIIIGNIEEREIEA